MTGTLLHVGTRKGLFVVDGSGANARVVAEHFLGDNVNLTLTDPRDGTWYAVLDHGHFGTKLHRSHDHAVQATRPFVSSQIQSGSLHGRPCAHGENPHCGILGATSA